MFDKIKFWLYTNFHWFNLFALVGVVLFIVFFFWK